MGLIEAVHQGVSECRELIYIQCSEDLFAQISGDLWMETQWMCSENCGIMNGRSCTIGALPVLCVRSEQRYPSYTLLHAWKTGDSSSLSQEEVQALEVAPAWAGEISPGSAQDVMRQIHDLISDRVEYDTDGVVDGNIRHTCLGALLEGMCVCDGYADTFFLLGGMCGLEVRLQTGLVPSGEENSDWRGNHMWNWVRVDGQWRMVDVTWDDLDPGVRYDYFNLPIDQVPADHTWVWGPDGVQYSSF